jgi:hypothetical protein
MVEKDFFSIKPFCGEGQHGPLIGYHVESDVLLPDTPAINLKRSSFDVEGDYLYFSAFGGLRALYVKLTTSRAATLGSC